MKMRRSFMRVVASLLLFAMCTMMLEFGCLADASDSASVVSYGLQVLAAGTDVAVSAPVGNEVTFSADVFARGLNLSRVDYVTVKTLPAVTDGELLLGSTRIAAGQTISAQNLSYVSFCASGDDVRHASFTFTANGGNIPMLCNVYLLEEVNYTPTLAVASQLSLSIATFKDMAVYSNFSAYDPDGDSLTFEVVSYPQNGAVRLLNASSGRYVYTPAQGFVGNDRFEYVARDCYGNYSSLKTVSVGVAQPAGSVSYADMKGNEAYVSALTLNEQGIMSGVQVGNQHFFYPEQTVSRVEFLVMAMNAAGIREVPHVDTTIFWDDAQIPDAMKGYVAAAYEMKYVSGTLQDGKLCFLPNEAITRAQAAVMLSNIVGLCDVPVTPTFADESDIPAWAAQSIYSLNAAGIMNGQGGYITPAAPVTRAQSAQMLAATLRYLK